MATIRFESGDTFTFPGGGGIVLPCGKAVIIAGGGRLGYDVHKGLIPDGALPGKPTASEITLALRAVVAAMSS